MIEIIFAIGVAITTYVFCKVVDYYANLMNG